MFQFAVNRNSSMWFQRSDSWTVQASLPWPADIAVLPEDLAVSQSKHDKEAGSVLGTGIWDIA